MSNKILIKRGSGAPTTSDLDNYEIAYDTGANKLYIRDGSDIIPFAAIVDEDNFASDDANRVPSQQSTKAYIASELAAAGAGDITAVVAGTGLSGGSTSGEATLNVSGLTVSEIAANSLTTSSESFADNDTTLMTSAAINDRITSFNYLTAHPNISAASSSDNSGRTYIQDITVDSNGHVTGIATATETVTDTNTTYSAGTGLSLSSTTFSTDDSEIVHDNLSGFVANEHINHTSVTLTAGAGLTGGGTIAANRTFAVGAGTGVTVNANDVAINFKDEDDMSSNSASHAATQQSIKAYVDAEVAGIVNSAPSALNTLDELAAALGDDANFATTTSTSLGNRLRVDTSSQGLTGTQQANAITNLGITATKAELNYVDGVTSNIQTQLDAKIEATLTNEQVQDIAGGMFSSNTETGIAATYQDGDGTIDLVVDYLPATDDRDVKPNAITTSGRKQVRAYFTTLEGLTGSSGSDYQDLLVLDTYSDGSGGDMNALAFDKSTQNIYHYLADQSDSTWGTAKRIAYIENGSNNRVMTASSSSTVTGEANLTFDGTTLQIDNRLHLDGTTPFIRIQESGVTNDPEFWFGVDGGNLSIRLNNSGTYPFQVMTNTDNNAVSSLNLGYNTTVQGNVTLNGFVLDGNTITGIDDSGEFTNNDAHIMTSAAVEDKILGYGYTTNTGDITAVVAGTGLSGGNTSGSATLNLDVGDLGLVGNGSIDSATNTEAEYSNLPVGYAKMMHANLGTDEGMPKDNQHFYFNKIANRDTGGGWAGIALGYNNNEEFYVGHTTTSSSFATWSRVVVEDSNGVVNPTSHIDMPDDARIKLGASDDLQIVHTGGINYIHSTSSNTDLYLRVNDGGTDKDAIIIDSSDNAQVRLPNDNQYLTFGAGGDGVLYSYNDDFYVSNHTAGNDILLTCLNSAGDTHNTIMFIDGSAQRVGINTTSPATEFHVNASGANGMVLKASDNASNSARLFFDGTSTSCIFQEGNDLSFRTGATTASSSGTERFFITSSGPEVPTGSQLYVDDIYGQSNGTNRLVLDDDTHSSVANGVSLTGVNHIYLCPDETNNGTGEVRVITGTDNDLDSGTADAVAKITNAGEAHFKGDVVAFSSSPSDRQLKENISTIENGLDKVMKLRGVEFDWTATSRKGQHDIGLIAQEVEEVLPEVVSVKTLRVGEFGRDGDEKDFKTINYEKMVGVLVEAVKELKAEIEELKK